MATFVWAAATIGNWSVGSNWKVAGATQASPPTTSDAVVFGSGTGATQSNCILNTTGSCLTIDFTSYTGTFTTSSQALNISGTSAIFSSGMTLTGNSSSAITISGATATLTTGGKSFPGTVSLTGSGVATVNQTPTFVNLTRTGTANANDQLQLASDMTVSGVLTLNGNSATKRLQVASTVPAIARTITCNGSISASNLDFSDITGAGSASWNLSGITGSCANLGGNSGITFTTPVTRYGVAAGAANWSATSTWSASSGGSSGASVPTGQDDVVLNASSGSGTYTMDIVKIGHNIDCTGFTGTLAFVNAIASYGNITLSSTHSSTGQFAWFTVSRTEFGNSTYTFNGHTLSTGLQITANNTVTFADNANMLYLLLGASNTGTVDTNNKNFTLPWTGGQNLVVSGGTLQCGTSTFTMSTTTAANGVSVTGTGIVKGGDATFVFASATANSRTFAGNGSSFGTLTYTVAGSTGSLIITGSNTFGTINFSDATNARTLQFTSGTTNTIGVRNIVGTSGKLMTVSAVTAGSAATLVSRGNWNIGSNSTLVSGNTGLTVAASSEMNFVSAKDITGTQKSTGRAFFGTM